MLGTGFIHIPEQPRTPGTICIVCGGGARSSLATAAFLRLRLGPLFSFAHAVLGTLLTPRGAAGAAACRENGVGWGSVWVQSDALMRLHRRGGERSLEAGESWPARVDCPFHTVL